MLHAEAARACVPEASLTKGQPEASSRLRDGLMTGVCGDPRTSRGVGVGRTPWHFWAARTAAWEPAGAVSSQSPQMSEGTLAGWAAGLGESVILLLAPSNNPGSPAVSFTTPSSRKSRPLCGGPPGPGPRAAWI